MFKYCTDFSTITNPFNPQLFYSSVCGGPIVEIETKIKHLGGGWWLQTKAPLVLPNSVWRAGSAAMTDHLPPRWVLLQWRAPRSWTSWETTGVSHLRVQMHKGHGQERSGHIHCSDNEIINLYLQETLQKTGLTARASRLSQTGRSGCRPWWRQTLSSVLLEQSQTSIWSFQQENLLFGLYMPKTNKQSEPTTKCTFYVLFFTHILTN